MLLIPVKSILARATKSERAKQLVRIFCPVLSATSGAPFVGDHYIPYPFSLGLTRPSDGLTATVGGVRIRLRG